MSKETIKPLPRRTRVGGTLLPHGHSTGEKPQPHAVWRINQCVEVKAFTNSCFAAMATDIGVFIALSTLFSSIGVVMLSHLPLKRGTGIGINDLLLLLFPAVVLVPFAIARFFFNGAHRSKGAFIRFHRGTRKIYHVAATQTHLHVFDWDRIEALAGYITGEQSAIRPLYLIGVDYKLPHPTEVCMACDNEIGYDDDGTQAKALWEYLQLFMRFGPEGLPLPDPLPAKVTRRRATLQPFLDWRVSLQNSLSTLRVKCWVPLMLPLRLLWLVVWGFPRCFGEYIQYNIPYTAFPQEIDELCGFTQPKDGPASLS